MRDESLALHPTIRYVPDMDQTLIELLTNGASENDDAMTSVENWPLRDRPGFLIRRVHQLHVSLFARECGDFDITPIQYSLLAALGELGSADQSQLALAIAMDRTTTAGALRRMEARGLVERKTLPTDRRAQFCFITAAGRELLNALEMSARKAHADTVSALSPAEQFLLLQLMQKIVDQADGPDATG